MSNYSNACAEVSTILPLLNKEEYNKIPPNVIEAIENNKNSEYMVVLDKNKELKNQNLLNETRALLLVIFKDYLATSQQKEKIKSALKNMEAEAEMQKKQKYNSNIFEHNIKSYDYTDNYNDNATASVKTNELIKVDEESFIKKIINKIKNFFNNSSK